MATQTAGNGNAKGTPESILEPAYMVAVGGGLSGSKAKTRTYTGRKGHITTSRYLRPKISSCHDRCKTGVRDEPPELKKPGRRLGVRKMWVKKKPARISVEPVERKKMTKPKPKPIPRPKISAREERTNRKSTQNELKLPIKHVKPKPCSSSVINGQKNKKEVTNNRNAGIVGKSTSAEQGAHKAAHTRSSPRKHKPESPRKDKGSKTKAKIKQLLAEKITEITLNEAESEELESVPPTVETVESPLKDERSMKETKLDQLIDEKITETTLHEAENAETIESSLKDEESTTKTKLKQLTAKKITEKTLQEAENAELESVPPTDETIESPPTVITESTNLSSSESSQSPSDKQVSEERENSKSSSDKQVSEERETSKASLDKQVSEEEHENADNGEVNVSEDDDKTVKREDKENEGSKGKFMRGRTVVESEDVDPRRLIIGKGKIPEDEDDGPTWLKFRRGKTVEGEEDDGPTKLNFRRGKILEDDEIDESFAKVNFKKTIVEEPTDDGKIESETVTLKHQEMQKKKEAQELLNRMIEETASKLEIDRKTKVEALVGAFETVISLKDDAPEKS